MFLDRPPRFLDADAVLSDNAGGAHAAVSHLIAAGHRRIAFLGGREAIHTALERRRGYHEALNKHDIAEDPELVRTDLYDAAEAHTAARELLLAPEPPTAIFSAQNLLTLGTLRALSELGARRTIAHVGFDDLQLSELLDPGLTVIAQNPHALGRLAAERIFARLDGDDGAYSHHVLPTTPHPTRIRRTPANGIALVRERGQALPLTASRSVQTSYGALYAQQMALTVLGALPLLIAFVLFQRQIVQGIAKTGLKG